MQRRTFIKTVAALPLFAAVGRDDLIAPSPQIAFDGKRTVNISGIGLAKPVRLAIAADTHFAFHDERDDAYADFYKRMAQWPSKKEPFEKMFADVAESKADGLLLLGDIISFPTLANVEYLKRTLDSSKVKAFYIAGNHDWHFEGDDGSDLEQRSRWTEKRLSPLYNGRNPLMYSVKIGGVRIVMIDNSAYHVFPEQVDFWRSEAAKGDPIVLAMHIPFWQEGYSITTCDAPLWGAAKDPYWQIERRQKWAERSMPSTTEFRREVFSTPNLVAVFAGHEHRLMFASDKDKMQIVVPSNRKGDYLEVSFK